MVTNFSPWGKTPFAFVSFRLSCSGLLVLTQSKQGCGGRMLNKIVLMSFYSSTSRVQPLWRSLVPDLVPSDATSSSRYYFLYLMFYFLSNPRCQSTSQNPKAPAFPTTPERWWWVHMTAATHNLGRTEADQISCIQVQTVGAFKGAPVRPDRRGLWYHSASTSVFTCQ